MTKSSIKTKIDELLDIARAYRSYLHRIGELLLEIEAEGEPMQPLYAMLSNTYGMSSSTIRVSMRWARGDFGTQHGESLVGKVPHSKLASWTSETIGAVCASQKHTIYSGDERRVCKKTFNEMTRREVSYNAGPLGFVPPHENALKIPEVRSCLASGFDIDSVGRVVFVSKGREAIHMTVNRSLLAQAMEANAGEA